MVINRFRLVKNLRTQVASLEEQVRLSNPEIELSTRDPALKRIQEVAFQVAATESTLLIPGESGTGKGVLARVIHAHSPRGDRPFVTVHCPSLSGELLESDLFGHLRGSFTGAVRDTDGKVAAAEGGTLFLDEIGDLSLALQPRLLRFLQDKAFERVGDTRTRHGNVRILAATNRDLEGEVRAGRFREDLLYQLNGIEIRLPPLRQRAVDISMLADHLLRFFARQANKSIRGFTASATRALLRHEWPGNLRELRNAVERRVILAREDQIDLKDLPSGLGQLTLQRLEVGSAMSLENLEIEHVRRILQSSDSLETAAQTLGIDPSTLYRKRIRYGLIQETA